jgi:hypothetical protein
LLSRHENHLELSSLFAAAAFLVSCRDTTSPSPDPFPVEHIQLSSEEVRLVAGTEVQLAAVPMAAAGRPRADVPVTWSSAKPEIAAVVDGRISGVSAGSTTITASAGGRSASVAVSVVSPTDAAAITVSPATLSLGPGESELVDAVGIDATGAVVLRQVHWRSSDASVAEVDVAGRIAAVAPGRARIIAELDGVEAAIELTVTAGAAIPSQAGKWTMAFLGENALPTAYRTFVNEDVGGHIVALVEIRIDSATKTMNADGTYARAYFFSEWHDGVKVLQYRWGDHGRYVVRRVEEIVTVRFVSEWIQNLSTFGAVVEDGLKLSESLWIGEEPEVTLWKKRP